MNEHTNRNGYFRPQPIDVNTVILAVKQLNNTNCVGSDEIPLKFVRYSLCILAPYLSCIINTSNVTGEFPDSWKHATVVPVFKYDDADKVNYFRPIYLLSDIYKILEKIIASQLTDYSETKRLLSNTQNGFRPRLSTETALTVIKDNIYNNMDKRIISLLTLCDLSKAFDSVNHQVLLRKCLNIKVDSF